MPRRGVIRYSTVRKFKGMESPAVVVYNVSGAIEKDDPLFYVASTRPKISLTILATQDAMMSISKLLST
jgi:DNA helicase IV